MGWWSNMSTQDWISLAELGADLYNAKSKKDKELNWGELYRAQNPNIYTPFMESTSSWDADTKTGTQIRKFTPEIQAMFDQLTNELIQPTKTRQTSRAQDELQNANLNWQRSRYGLDPVEYQERSRVDSIINEPIAGGGQTAPVDDIDTVPEDTGIVGGVNDDGFYELEDANSEQDIGQALDQIQREIINRNRGQGGVGGGGGRGYNDGSGGYMSNGRWRPYESDSEIDQAFGNELKPVVDYEQFTNGIGDSSFMSPEWWVENGKWVGDLVSAGTGIPMLGLSAKQLAKLYMQRNTFMNPVNESDPYGQQAQQGRENQIVDALMGQDYSNMTSAQRVAAGLAPLDIDTYDPNALVGGYDGMSTNPNVNLPNTGGRFDVGGYGYNQGRDSRGSITGGGGYGYATRLRARDPEKLMLNVASIKKR